MAGSAERQDEFTPEAFQKKLVEFIIVDDQVRLFIL